MAIPTTRTKECAAIKIDTDKCTGCGLCVSICSDYSLCIKEGKAAQSDSAVFGCIACGHCMAVCPQNAITITGRELSPEDMFSLPDRSSAAGYDQLLALFQRRRSIRDFSEREVEAELVEKILTAATTAPMGIPPSDVNVLVLHGKEKTRAFAKDFSEYLKGMRFMTSGLFLSLMRPFWGKETDELFKKFMRPLFKTYIEDMEEGNNYINYDAPLEMYFYASPYADPADPVIAATYAMIAAESLGLGTCMLGAVHPFIQNGSRAQKFREKYNIRYKSREGLFVVFGYPKFKFQKGINRTFASVTEVKS